MQVSYTHSTSFSFAQYALHVGDVQGLIGLWYLSPGQLEQFSLPALLQ